MDGRCSLFILTSTVLMISIPSNGSQKTDGGENRNHSLKSVNLAPLRPKRPIPSRVQKNTDTQVFEYLHTHTFDISHFHIKTVFFCV